MKLALFTLSLALAACQGTRPDDLGVKEGSLRPCPSRPNCVESRAGADEEHRIAPIAAGEDPDGTFARLVGVLEGTERVAVVTKSPEYVHAEFTTKVMRFVDDAEFLLDRSAKMIHVRAAARLGYRDFGVNREHVEAVRAALGQASTTPSGG